jgi:hypothetical protein
LQCRTGLAGRGIKEAGLVALSHTRANQGWLAQRYKRLKLYPRGRIGLDYVMGHDDLINWNDGISAGAAYVGESRIVWNDRTTHIQI